MTVIDAAPNTNGDGQAAKRVAWEERLAPIKRQFPSTRDESWHAALHDYALIGRILREILRVGNTENRRGQRSTLDLEEGMARLRQLTGEDFSILPFAEAFTVLAREARLEEVAAKVGLAPTRCQRLLDGSPPLGAEMEKVARAFRKAPTYFVEYRVGVVCAFIAEHLANAPEASVGLVRLMNVNTPN